MASWLWHSGMGSFPAAPGCKFSPRHGTVGERMRRYGTGHKCCSELNPGRRTPHTSGSRKGKRKKGQGEERERGREGGKEGRTDGQTDGHKLAKAESSSESPDQLRLLRIWVWTREQEKPKAPQLQTGKGFGQQKEISSRSKSCCLMP